MIGKPARGGENGQHVSLKKQPKTGSLFQSRQEDCFSQIENKFIEWHKSQAYQRSSVMISRHYAL